MGGGITWDSLASTEYEETVAKARVLTTRRPAFRLFETLRHDGSGYRLLEEHLGRMGASARYFGFAFEHTAARRELARLARTLPPRPMRVRLLSDRRGGIEVESSPLPPEAGPVRLAIDEGHPVDPSDPLLFHKTTLRGPYEGARARHPDSDDVVLVNARGEVTESTIANVAAQIGGLWYTPPISAGLLNGCERARRLAEGSLRERPITVMELRDAPRVALLSSVRGWREAVVLPQPGAGPG